MEISWNDEGVLYAYTWLINLQIDLYVLYMHNERSLAGRTTELPRCHLSLHYLSSPHGDAAFLASRERITGRPAPVSSVRFPLSHITTRASAHTTPVSLFSTFIASSRPYQHAFQPEFTRYIFCRWSVLSESIRCFI